MRSCRLGEEIVAVPVAGKKGDTILFSVDEHPRPDTTLEALSKLKGIVKPGGTVTAGNASRVDDGACALLLASEAAGRPPRVTTQGRRSVAAGAGRSPRPRWYCRVLAAWPD